MAKLLKIKEKVEHCWKCSVCHHVYDVMIGDITYECKHPIIGGKEMTDEENDNFPDWCPLNNYPYDK